MSHGASHRTRRGERGSESARAESTGSRAAQGGDKRERKWGTKERGVQKGAENWWLKIGGGVLNWAERKDGKEAGFNKRRENGLKQRWITSTRQGSGPKRMRLGGYIYLKGARAETDEETNQAGTMFKWEVAVKYMRNSNDAQRASECKQKLFLLHIASRSPAGRLALLL